MPDSPRPLPLITPSVSCQASSGHAGRQPARHPHLELLSRRRQRGRVQHLGRLPGGRPAQGRDPDQGRAFRVPRASCTGGSGVVAPGTRCLLHQPSRKDQRGQRQDVVLHHMRSVPHVPQVAEVQVLSTHAPTIACPSCRFGHRHVGEQRLVCAAGVHTHMRGHGERLLLDRRASSGKPGGDCPRVAHILRTRMSTRHGKRPGQRCHTPVTRVFCTSACHVRDVPRASTGQRCTPAAVGAQLFAGRVCLLHARCLSASFRQPQDLCL